MAKKHDKGVSAPIVQGDTRKPTIEWIETFDDCSPESIVNRTRSIFLPTNNIDETLYIMPDGYHISTNLVPGRRSYEDGITGHQDAALALENAFCLAREYDLIGYPDLEESDYKALSVSVRKNEAMMAAEWLCRRMLGDRITPDYSIEEWFMAKSGAARNAAVNFMQKDMSIEIRSFDDLTVDMVAEIVRSVNERKRHKGKSFTIEFYESTTEREFFLQAGEGRKITAYQIEKGARSASVMQCTCDTGSEICCEAEKPKRKGRLTNLPPGDMARLQTRLMKEWPVVPRAAVKSVRRGFILPDGRMLNLEKASHEEVLFIADEMDMIDNEGTKEFGIRHLQDIMFSLQLVRVYDAMNIEVSSFLTDEQISVVVERYGSRYGAKSSDQLLIDVYVAQESGDEWILGVIRMDSVTEESLKNRLLFNMEPFPGYPILPKRPRKGFAF